MVGEDHEHDVTVAVSEVLGRAGAGPFAGRNFEQVQIPWQDSTTSRQRLVGGLGTHVTLNLPRGTFLAHGDVLADLGDRILVVERVEETVLVARPQTVAQAVAIGHAFGNQHAPLEISDDEIVVPITSSVAVMFATAADLAVPHELCRRRPFSHISPKRAAGSTAKHEPPAH